MRRLLEDDNGKVVLNRGPGTFLFLDESGDVGMSQKSSPYLVITILHLGAEYCLERISKRVRRKRLRRAGPLTELKWSNSSPEVRLEMLKEATKVGDLLVGISACVMSKGWANREHASRGADIRYNYAARFAMEQGGLFDPARSRRVLLTIDERNIAATAAMREHLRVLSESSELCCEVDLRAGKSHELGALQAVDFIAGAISTAYAAGDFQYVNFLRSRGAEIAVRTPGWKAKK